MRTTVVIFFCSFATVALGQIGGKHSFDFLLLSSHARAAALGGVNVSLADRDVNFFHNNPALTGDSLNGFASAGYQFHVGDVGSALLTYAHNFSGFGQLVMGVQHTHYGPMAGYDESGNATGEFSAGETAVVLGKSHRVGNFRLGAAIKGVFSNIAGYRANAVMIDLGGIFKHPQSDLTLGLTMKNLGLVLDGYGEARSMRLPFDVQAGVTFKPEHMPLRFSLTGYNLVDTDLLPTNKTTGATRPSRLSEVLSHVNAGAEILLHRHVNVMLGYNYLLHQALRWETARSVGGLCYGFSVAVSPVEFVFARSAYTVGNAGYSFTLSTNTNQLLKRKNI